MPIAIQCRDLRKTYDGKVEAVRGLNLEIQAGECFGLLGPNGAGKTTTIEILEGLLEPTSGEVSILGHPGVRMRARCGSGWAFRCRKRGYPRNCPCAKPSSCLPASIASRVRPMRCLSSCNLTEKADAWVGKLSGGQRQRLAVATALVCNPKILFLDEPTTGLDPQSRRQLWDIIREFQRDGGTVLLTTHYMDEAERLCDRLAIVDHGQVIAEGSPADLIERLGGHHVVEFAVSGNSDGAALEVWRALPSVESVREDDGMLSLNVKEPHLAIPALLDALGKRGSELQHLTTRQASLEDVFVRLTGRHLREE